MLSDEQLREIQARCDAATPGPWSWFLESDSGFYVVWRHLREETVGDVIGESDADFIALARTDVPALIAEVRRLRALARAILPAAHAGCHFARVGKNGRAVMEYSAAYDALAAALDGEGVGDAT